MGVLNFGKKDCKSAYQSKSWVYTMNNYTDKHIELLKNLECSYNIFGLEIGEKKGTPHIQGCITFRKPRRFSAMKRDFKGFHLEGCLDLEGGRNYCMKDLDFTIVDNRKQGERNDIEDVISCIKDGNSLRDVKLKYPNFVLRYNRNLEVLYKLHNPTSFKGLYDFEDCYNRLSFSSKMNKSIDFKDFKVLVLVGDSQIGKTQFALSLFKQPMFVSHLDSLKDFTEGFHDGLIFDDMTFSHLPETAQIHLLDWEMDREIHIRYQTALIPKNTKKIFTCNYNRQCQLFAKDPAVYNRISNIIDVKPR